jgi:hypothetical protein
MLCKRKFAARYDESVAVVMMYSNVDNDFFADCARNGHCFVETEPGVSACTDAAVKYYAVNLVEYGATRRSSPMLLFSSQHQQFRPAERELGLFQAIFEEVRYKELKHMAQSQYAVRPEGYEELHKWFLQSCTVEERLEGISVMPARSGCGVCPPKKSCAASPSRSGCGVCPPRMCCAA